MIFLEKWFVGYGAFLFLCGLAGYLSNPAEAKTALISGTVFGFLSIGWGVAMRFRWKAARPAAVVTTTLLTLVFVWRSAVSWMAVATGEPKLFAASLISLMLAGSLATLWVLWRFGSAGQ